MGDNERERKAKRHALIARPLETRELSVRWRGLATCGTLRNWRSNGIGPACSNGPASPCRVSVVYPLAEVQRFELERSSVSRNKPWRGEFITADELLRRWKGTPREVASSTLRYWRTSDGAHRGPTFVRIHTRGPLYPIEAVIEFENERDKETADVDPKRNRAAS